jgi:serine/threonine protein kinase
MDELPAGLAEQVLAYEEAKAIGEGGRVDFVSSPESASDRLEQNLACVDLLHRVWPAVEALPSPCELISDKTVGDYRIIREIGRGGMGAVYEAEQLSLGRRVALKVLPFAALATEAQVRRFTNEARAAATLQHPNIVPVYSVGREGNVHYYTMQYIDGPSLAEVLEELRAASREQGAGSMEPYRDDTCATAAASTWKSGLHRDRPHPDPLPKGEGNLRPNSQMVNARVAATYAASKSTYFRTVVRWGVQLAETLTYAHENGVLHRDIKPANILLDVTGQPWLTDFGLARLAAEATMTMSGDLLGTLRYMAPEQALGKRAAVDNRADIYSLAITLYELLALRPAFAGEDRGEVLRQIALDEPRPLRKVDRSIPSDLDVILRKAANKNPTDRYKSAQGLADDLQRFLDHKPIRAKQPGLFERTAKWTRRRPAVAALVAISLLAIIALWTGTLWHARTLSAALKQSEENRQKAVASEQHALQRERSLRTHQYALRMKLAGEAWETRNARPLRDWMAQRSHEKDEAKLRGFEWYFLWNLCQPKCETLTGHKKVVGCVAYSPDDRLLATASEDGTVKIWNTDSHALVTTLRGHSSCVNKVAFAPDGTWLASSSCDHTVKIWDTRTFLETANFSHEFPVYGLAISPDGRTIASGIGIGDALFPKSYDVVLWDVVTGQPKRVL